MQIRKTSTGTFSLSVLRVSVSLWLIPGAIDEH